MITRLKPLAGVTFGMFAIFLLSKCSDSANNDHDHDHAAKDSTEMMKMKSGGFDNQVAWGEHLVMIGGCEDCQTPKKMTDRGPVNDDNLKLSGHPAGMPAPDVDRKMMESKGYFVSQTLTAWVGPWGISYAANLTSDSATGIGAWPEQSFINALRIGKHLGNATDRDILPPMPWPIIGLMTDTDLKAVYAFNPYRLLIIKCLSQ